MFHLRGSPVEFHFEDTQTIHPSPNLTSPITKTKSKIRHTKQKHVDGEKKHVIFGPCSKILHFRGTHFS